MINVKNKYPVASIEEQLMQQKPVLLYTFSALTTVDLYLCWLLIR